MRQDSFGSKKIKVVHLSTYSSGGAAVAALRIHNSLPPAVIDSSFLFRDGAVPAGIRKNVFKIAFPPVGLPARIARKIKRILSGTEAGPQQQLKNKMASLLPQLQCEIATLPFAAIDVLQHPAIQAADIIHLHWIAGTINYPDFFNRINKPVVWTLHDMNPFQGIFHYKEDEVTNGKIAGGFDNAVSKIKTTAINRCKQKVHVITPSQWLANSAKQSPAFSNRQTAVIPYPVNFDLFKPVDTDELRKRFDIKPSETVFLFVAQHVENKRKGFDLLSAALEKINTTHCRLLIIGEPAHDVAPPQNFIYLGTVNDDASMAAYYSLANAFIIPSREDNFPNVMIEANACGTPVISFNVGGMAEYVVDGLNGLKAAAITANSLAGAITGFIETKDQYKAGAIRAHAMQHFQPAGVGQQYHKIYSGLLDAS